MLTWIQRSPGFLLGTVVVVAALLGTPEPARAQGDMIDLTQATVWHSPADIASWPITTTITRLDMQPSGAPASGLSFQFSAKSTWPNYTPPGWTGPIVYTVWAVVKVNGQWHTAGFIQMWRDRASTGAPLLHKPGGICGSHNEFACNWAYSSRWGPISYTVSGYEPQANELVGFFVSAGNARDTGGVTSVRERSNVIAVNLPANDTGVFTFASGSSTLMSSIAIDVSGDGKADIGVWRPGTGTWFGLSSDNGYASGSSLAFGMNGDVPVVGDYDNDGKADLALWRPSSGVWSIKTSSSGFAQTLTIAWGSGSVNDVPVPADYDGDGKTDVAVWRPGNGTWYILLSGSGNASQILQWGSGALDDRPVPRDYDGDGKADIAVWWPGDGRWYIRRSSNGSSFTVQWGSGSVKDVPVPGDYDGDGRADIAVWRPGTGVWYVKTSGSSYASWYSAAWGSGALNDRPIVGDFDGDHRADLAVWRPGDGRWYVRTSGSNYTNGFTIAWGSGAVNDVPIGMNSLRR
jgi:hypothetical protein